MRSLIVIGALLAATAADAQGYRTVIQRTGSGVTVSTYRTEPVPSVIIVPKLSDAEEREKAERIAVWERRCQPIPGPPDRHGVRRMTYAAPGCDTGN